MDCGPTCLRMVAKYYGRHYSSENLRQKTGYNKMGVSLLGISEAAEKIGFRTRGVKISIDQLKNVQLPCILHWDQDHFLVLIKTYKNKLKVADPGKGIITYTNNEFLKHWLSSVSETTGLLGTALLMEPTPLFYESANESESKISWRRITQYLTQSKSQIGQVFIALITSSILQLIFPFLTQSIVDTGIASQNLNFVVVILIAQLMLTFSQTTINFIRSRLLLRISNLMNLQILSDFWIKLTRLPVSYFDIHHTGDTLQRIGDHAKIQNFLTNDALNTLFSIFNFLVYAIILMMYKVELFVIFCIGSIAYFGWVQIFLNIRRKLNYQTFYLAAKENDASLQLIQGMQEIRLNNAEKQKRWQWENIQASLFKINLKGLNFSQWQSAGAILIGQVQNIIISFIVTKLVIEGSLTLGAMLAVQYIIGQLGGPISQWVGFMQSIQDAKIGMERLNEIHQLANEEKLDKEYITQLPENKNIQFNKLSFTYPGVGNDPVLKDIQLNIPQGKVTAIVGSSGSGKTTLLKILLKIYEEYQGEIRIGGREITNSRLEDENDLDGGIPFNNISHYHWRQICGAVMQDGYIFNDTIAQNIAVGHDNVDYERLLESCKIANIYEHIKSLPNGFYTKLGVEGIGLSQGQKQRLLIARAIYKKPEYLFFDEATNALDANNEKEIIKNLEKYFIGKTVIVVAHRLSTVKNADKIIVLHRGKIVEEGTHDFLTSYRGKYYELVKNQLELGN